MRNFWIELDIDGRKTSIKAGPASKDGGFQMKIHQRVLGRSVVCLEIKGEVLQNKDLSLTLTAKDYATGRVNRVGQNITPR